MSDPERPALPDPQHDRHVAFPELTPPTSSDAKPSPAPGLPPDAWARHEPTPGPAPTLPPPSVPSTPPTRPAYRAARRRPAWIPYAAVIGIFIVIGNANSGDDPSLYPEGGYSSQEWGGPADPWVEQAPDPSTAGWVTTVEDSSRPPEPLALDSPVSPFPPDTTVLRVEVVSASAQDVALTISTSSGLHEESSERTPLAKEIHLGSATTSVTVAASSTDGSGDILQCRIYAGTDLVAIHTMGTGSVSCELAW